jgi:hypothetical protein
MNCFSLKIVGDYTGMLTKMLSVWREAELLGINTGILAKMLSVWRKGGLFHFFI